MLRIDEQCVYDYLEECGGMPEIEESVKLIKSYRLTIFYERKTNLLAQWEIDHKGIYELIISVFTACLTDDHLTIQGLVGRLNHKIKLDDEINRIEILADIIGLISTTGLISIDTEIGKYHMVSTEYEIDTDIPELDKHATMTQKFQPIESNWYEGKSVMLGHRMNHHEGFVRLSHLNTMGQVAFTLNQKFIAEYEEAPKYEPKTKKEKLQWEAFRDESSVKYEELGDGKFHVRHSYDTRGRSYSGSYYLDPQGSSYKKAIIDLTNKEIVEGF